MNRAPEEFTTERLRATRVLRSDVDFITAMFADPQVHRTLGGPRDGGRIVEVLDRWSGQWDSHGFGLWVLREREDARPVGWTMLTATETGGPGVEVGWAVASDCWRRGYATEAGAEAVRIGFEDLGLDELVSFTLVDNVASQGVMKKLGFVYERDVEHVGLPHVLYRLYRKDWEANHG